MITRAELVNAALPHVPFDGWGDQTFRAAVSECGASPDLARALFPRGGVDLAVEFHRMGDRQLVQELNETDLSDLRFRERIALAVKLRLNQIPDKELVRRGAALFALPQFAPSAARLIWETADTIWCTLGDTSEDFNWYTKRATLSGVYSATVLFWLGDNSQDDQETWKFLNRRIEDVMQFEKSKAKLRETRVMDGVFSALETIRRPPVQTDLPGRWAKE